jgi:hypothetical protein
VCCDAQVGAPFTRNMNLWLSALCAFYIVIKERRHLWQNFLDSPFASIFWLVIYFCGGYVKSRGFQTYSADIYNPKLRISEETETGALMMPS